MEETSSGDCTRKKLASKGSNSNQVSTHEFFLLATVLDTNIGLAAFIEDFKGEVFDIGLDFGILVFTTDETLGIEDTNINKNGLNNVMIRSSDMIYERVVWVHRNLILSGIADQAFTFREGYV